MLTCPICDEQFNAEEFIHHSCQPKKAPVKTNNIIGSSANMRLNVENLQTSIFNIKVSAEVLEDQDIMDIQEELENLEKALVLVLDKKYNWK